MKAGVRSTSAGRWVLVALLVSVPLLIAVWGGLSSTGATPAAGTYTNPLVPQIPSGGVVQDCPDPTVFRSQTAGDDNWYMFCTTDPLNDTRDSDGHLVFHDIPMMQSPDLVNWTYVGDALTSPPSWAQSTAAFWAPDVVYSKTFGQYYLFYAVTDVTDEISGEPGCTEDRAIGVATSATPTGPWTASSTPVVPPRRDGEGCNFLSTIDPDVLGDVVKDQGQLYFGGFRGGIVTAALSLTADGASISEPETQITISRRYEGATIVERRGYYYLFASATLCCNGPLTGYTVLAGRSADPLGPFVDRTGNSLLAGRVGGTPVISMNGNQWVGTGHDIVFRDFDGQWWTMYHAIDRYDPYFGGAVGLEKRPPLLDPVDWVHGWPTVRGGRWASDGPMPAPAAQPGTTSDYVTDLVDPLREGAAIASASDDFDGTQLDPKWTWVREPDATNTASVLTIPAPDSDYMVTTRVQLNVPPDGCCYNFVQAGLVIYENDDNYVKLAHASNDETRTTIFGKEMSPVPAGYPTYGNSTDGAPADWTYLRIVRQRVVPDPPEGPTEKYTAFTSQDGSEWTRGGVWTHQLGPTPMIGLVSMGGSGFVANFDYVHVNRLRGQ